MIKIWRYRKSEPWLENTIDLEPDLSLEEFLKHMHIPKDPKIVLGDSYTTLAVFKDKNSIYYMSLELQELKEILVFENLQDLLTFMKAIAPLLLCFSDMMESFGNAD